VWYQKRTASNSGWYLVLLQFLTSFEYQNCQPCSEQYFRTWAKNVEILSPYLCQVFLFLGLWFWDLWPTNFWCSLELFQWPGPLVTSLQCFSGFLSHPNSSYSFLCWLCSELFRYTLILGGAIASGMSTTATSATDDALLKLQLCGGFLCPFFVLPGQPLYKW
jgi:hypothetical protein